MADSYPEVQRFLDRHVVQELFECAQEGWSLPLSYFVNEWIDKRMASALCRSLRDRGYLTYNRGLFTDDGEPAGSGYSLTEKGRLYYCELMAAEAV